MWTYARPHVAAVVGLSVLLILASHATLACGDLDMPATGRANAILNARQSAEDIVLATAALNDAMTAASAVTVDSALTAARQYVRAAQARKAEDQAGPVRVRYVAVRPSVVAAPQPPAPPGVARVPILMYHHIADPAPNADAIGRDLSVSPAAFAQQMAYLRKNDYHTISLADLADALQNDRPLPPRPVVLTFDDGYLDNYTQAYPILRQNGFTATFFIVVSFAGQPGYASWEQIAEMSRQNMDIGAHGFSHADLAISSAAEVTRQAAESRRILEEKMGRLVPFFCYPSGRYTAETIAILRAGGYRAAVTTAYGATHNAANPFELRRVRIRGADTLEHFAVKLETAP